MLSHCCVFRPLTPVAALVALLFAHGASADSPAAPDSATSAPPPAVSSPTAVQPADLDLGGQVILRLRAAAGGLTPEQRVSVVESRLTDILGNPIIKPSDVVVYHPAAGPPVIFALGRRLITVDAATVAAAGTPGAAPLTVAVAWARRLQQVLPRVNWRPPNMPETVVPAHPPLTITTNLAEVGGSVGSVRLRDKVVIRLHGLQPGQVTAAERADQITARLAAAAAKVQGADPGQVQVTSDGGTAELAVAGTPIIEVTDADAHAAGIDNAADLADSWAKNVRSVLGLTPTPQPPAQ